MNDTNTAILNFSIKRTKIKLYRLLLLKDLTITDNEIDIAYYLSIDDDIQEVLEKAKKG